MRTDPSDSAALCATALAICLAWFEQTRPDATIRAEVESGDWRLISMTVAIERALAAFRDEHGVTDE